MGIELSGQWTYTILRLRRGHASGQHTRRILEGVCSVRSCAVYTRSYHADVVYRHTSCRCGTAGKVATYGPHIQLEDDCNRRCLCDSSFRCTVDRRSVQTEETGLRYETPSRAGQDTVERGAQESFGNAVKSIIYAVALTILPKQLVDCAKSYFRE